MIGEETAIYIMSGLIGVPYPEGDPEIIRAAARYWRKVSTLMADCEKFSEKSAAVMAEGRQSGASITSFYDLVEEVLPRVGRLKQATAQMATDLDKWADKLQRVQREFNYIASQVAADLVITVAFGIVTVGLFSAVTALYLSRVFVIAFRIFGAYRKAAMYLASTVTYWVLDSLAYAALDVGGLKAVDWWYGENRIGWNDFWRTGAANVAFDAAFDGQAWAISKTLGPAVAGSIWTRAAMRMVASGFVYTPADRTLQMLEGKEIKQWLPKDNEWGQKTVIHGIGRVMFTEPYREVWKAGGKALTRSIIGR